MVPSRPSLCVCVAWIEIRFLREGLSSGWFEPRYHVPVLYHTKGAPRKARACLPLVVLITHVKGLLLQSISVGDTL
jgi:hypothetical protein